MAKRFRVEITSAAENDIAAFRDYIAADKPRAATKWATRIEQLIRDLDRFPLRCEVIPEAEEFGKEYRHLLFGKYRVIFRIEDDRVTVIRVVHSAQLLTQGMLRKS